MCLIDNKVPAKRKPNLLVVDEPILPGHHQLMASSDAGGDMGNGRTAANANANANGQKQQKLQQRGVGDGSRAGATAGINLE